MKIFCHIPREKWFCDRYGDEYKNYSTHEVSFDTITNETDVIWLLASWCWNQIDHLILSSKKVFTDLKISFEISLLSVKDVYSPG